MPATEIWTASSFPTELPRQLPSGVSSPAKLPMLPRRPVSPQIRSRLESYLDMHPDFAYASPLRIAAGRGWIEQESIAFGAEPPTGRCSLMRGGRQS